MKQKYHYLTIKRDDPKAFMEYSDDMQDNYKNIEDYNLGKKGEV